MVRHSAEAFLSHDLIDQLWIVVAEGQEELLSNVMASISEFNMVVGGSTRQESVSNGLSAIAANGFCDLVLVHDAARPFLDHEVIDRLLCSLDGKDAAIPVLPVIDTIIEEETGELGGTLNRDILRRVQTPQAFDFKKLFSVHRTQQQNRKASDDSQLFQAAGHVVTLVQGDEKLKKYTTMRDFDEERNIPIIRTGMGFDVHQLAADEELWLGGIKIEHDRGLVGHSDADVLLHALTDALLGAVGAGDIGDHFPPSDPQWRGASSRQFVEYATKFITEIGGAINNVDITLICEKPKIKPHRNKIRQNIADILYLALDRVSLKATTTEGLGYTGRGEGIAAQAIATISMNGEN